jgi:hypothetical protein
MAFSGSTSYGFVFWLIVFGGHEPDWTAVAVIPMYYFPVLLLSLMLVRTKWFSFIPAFLSSIAAAFLFLLFVSILIVTVFARTDTFYFGIDVQTPRGVVSGVSMVETRNSIFPIAVFQRYGNGKVRIHGEAAYCDLGDGRCVIALLDIDAHPQWMAVWPRGGQPGLNGQTIISFRGTDDHPGDWPAWLGGLGEPYTQQAMHAIDMYNAVLANNIYRTGRPFSGRWACRLFGWTLWRRGDHF